jgi:hypothetical protein
MNRSSLSGISPHCQQLCSGTPGAESQLGGDSGYVLFGDGLPDTLGDWDMLGWLVGTTETEGWLDGTVETEGWLDGSDVGAVEILGPDDGLEVGISVGKDVGLCDLLNKCQFFQNIKTVNTNTREKRP